MVVMTAEQCDCTQCHRTAHLRMVNMVNFYVVNILPWFKKKIRGSIAHRIKPKKTKKKWAALRGAEFPVTVAVQAGAGQPPGGMALEGISGLEGIGASDFQTSVTLRENRVGQTMYYLDTVLCTQVFIHIYHNKTTFYNKCSSVLNSVYCLMHILKMPTHLAPIWVQY